MAEKEQQAYQPPIANGYNRADEEAAAEASEEFRRQKRKKLIMYIVAFVIFQTIVIVIMSLTVMKIRTPKYRLRSAEFESFNYTGNSFDMTMNAHLRVKNMNFGTFKYDASNITFYYGDVEVGIATVPKEKVGWLSSKKFTVAVPLSSENVQNNSTLTSELSTGVLPLTVKSKLSGKVRLTFMFKKKKSTQMNCSFQINLSSKQIQNMKC